MAIALELTLSPAEYAVLWHVQDTVVISRASLAVWTADNLPNNVPHDLTVDHCLQAAASLIQRGLLVELTAAEIEADLARWRTEALPVSWGVDRNRRPGDVDLTEQGFRVMEALSQRDHPNFNEPPAIGYNDETTNLIRVFGQDEASCQTSMKHVLRRIDQAPWHWPRGSVEVGPTRALGPWWKSRFERIPTGFEIPVRRV